jgi:acyl-CoA thioesterase-1
VAADRALNQPDGIHPTAEGHEVIADTVWEALGEVLRVAAEATHATADAGAGP